MSPWLIVFFAAELIGLGALIWLLVVAFRTSLKWGIVSLLVPFGSLVFASKHWSKAGVAFLISRLGFIGCAVVYALHPEPFAPYVQQVPALQAMLAHTQHVTALIAPTPPPPPPGKPPKREAVDVADAESLVSQRDALLFQQTAYDKHAAELTATYEQLKTARAKLKGGGPALAAYNARAAHYQDDCRSLAAEKARLDSLQHTVAAVTAAARATTQTVANVSQGSSAPAAGNAPPPGAEAPVTRAQMEAAVQRAQAIVNQVPPTVTKPPGAQSWNYGYHPGATKPDFNKTDIVSGRELWLHDYIDMQGSPGVYYRGTDCEFNSQTKFFFTNRSLPKKRLTDAEYQELVRLYRFLGRCEHDLNVVL